MSASPSSTRIDKTALPPEAGLDAVARASATPKPMPIMGDQPTIISNRPPLPAHSASDSAYRILEGRIMPGDHLGHFELLDYVGGGGMGRVFRASDTRLARIVALKVLSPDQASDEETVQRFQNEAQSAARLDHENIARVHYVGEDRGIHFIAFEFVEGVNVRVLVEQRGPLPLAEALNYTLQVAEALSHADARSVVHRDIKPSNVIITPEGRVKLIDMGLARMRQQSSSSADLTASGVTLGTFDYISPEQARDPRNADTRSDIYSLGCTLFFMLTGRPPFLDGTVLQKLLQHQTEQPPSVHQFRPELPDEADAILQKMLAKDPDNRHRDAGELVREVWTMGDRLGLQTIAPSNLALLEPVAARSDFWRRHFPWMAAVASLLAIVIGLEAYWTLTAPPANTQTPPFLSGDALIPEIAGSERHEPSRSPGKVPGKNGPTAKKIEGEANAVAPPARERDSGTQPRGIGNSLGTTGDYFGQTDVPRFRSTAPAAIGATGGGIPLDAASISPSWPANNASAAPLNFGFSEKYGFNSPLDAPKRNGVLAVTGRDGENEFGSLAAACAAAHDGDIIELRYNGPHEERPLALSNLHLTIRAGDGFAPTVVFRPREADPVICPRGMFALRSGRLSLINLSLELVVPSDIPAERWSLFDICGGQTVRVDRCVLTIANAGERGAAYRPSASFFQVSAPAGSNVAAEDEDSGSLPAAKLELLDTFARGEAVLLSDDELQPVNLNWENGLLVTSESLLAASGNNKETKSEGIQIELRHVTAVTRGGLCRLSGVSSASPPAVQWNCADNIFVCPPGVAWIQQEGVGPLENLRRQIAWNGDLNFYDTLDVFWTIRRSGDSTADVMNFAAWQNYWGPSRENQPMSGRIDWKRPPSFDRPAHLQSPADYALNRAHFENPALGAASDGSDAGVQASRLLAPKK